MLISGLPLLLIAVLMYGAWRFWLWLRGESWKPTGKPMRRNYAATMQEHVRTTFPPLTRGQKVQMAVTMIVTYSLIAAFVWWVLNR